MFGDDTWTKTAEAAYQECSKRKGSHHADHVAWNAHELAYRRHPSKVRVTLHDWKAADPDSRIR